MCFEENQRDNLPLPSPYSSTLEERVVRYCTFTYMYIASNGNSNLTNGFHRMLSITHLTWETFSCFLHNRLTVLLSGLFWIQPTSNQGPVFSILFCECRSLTISSYIFYSQKTLRASLVRHRWLVLWAESTAWERKKWEWYSQIASSEVCEIGHNEWIWNWKAKTTGQRVCSVWVC